MNQKLTTDANMQAQREAVSAWLDGHVPVVREADLNPSRLEPHDMQTWADYHFIGEAMRGHLGDVRVSQSEFLKRWQSVREADTHVAPLVLIPEQTRQLALPVAAANDGLWKRYAGFFALVLGVGLGWKLWAESPMGADQVAHEKAATTAVVLAVQTPSPAAEQTKPPTQAQTKSAALDRPLVVVTQQGNAMVRDPELDELLSRHKQLGGTTALQTPAGFMRSATFSPESTR